MSLFSTSFAARPDGPRPFQCDECKRILSDSSNLKKYVTSKHTNNNNLKCPKCKQL